MESNPNLCLYERIRQVPEEAVKTIAAGRLKGMSDINPMWRIKNLLKNLAYAVLDGSMKS